MIENMINKAHQYLPLKISEVLWDGTTFQMNGALWNFATLSAWRLSSFEKVYFGCCDDNSDDLIKEVVNLEIMDICFQSEFLKIDPVFILSNGKRLEIFSTDVYEPWTFFIEELGMYIATPGEPTAFEYER